MPKGPTKIEVYICDGCKYLKWTRLGFPVCANRLNRYINEKWGPERDLIKFKSSALAYCDCVLLPENKNE